MLTKLIDLLYFFYYVASPCIRRVVTIGLLGSLFFILLVDATLMLVWLRFMWLRGLC